MINAVSLKWWSLFLVAISVGACSKISKNPAKAIYEKNHIAFESADYNLSSGNLYYELNNQTLTSITDSLLVMNAIIITDKAELDSLNKQVIHWLKDSLFIFPQGKKNDFRLDSVNVLTQPNGLNYYMDEEITPRTGWKGHLLELENSSFTAVLPRGKIFYSIVPCNAVLIDTTGVFRVETTGKFMPRSSGVGGKPDKCNFRYSCRKFSMDWFIVASSDDYLDRSMAMTFKDSTLYYSSRTLDMY